MKGGIFGGIQVIHSLDSNIIYLYRACDGNKNRAQLNGIEWALHHYSDQIKYVLLIDDDVQIPDHYRLERTFFENKKVRGIIYPILATSDDQKNNLITRWQNIEYQLSDLTLSALDAFQSAPAPHGACVLLEIKTAQSILQRHSGRFKGEDKEIGEILHNMYDVHGPLTFRVDMAVHFKTVVPSSYLGYGNNLWKQRVRSWAEAPFLYPWHLVLKPLLADWRVPVKALPLVKLTQIYHLLSQCSHILRYYIMAIEAKNPKFWITFTLFSGMQFGVVLLFNYQKLPPYLRNDLLSTTTFIIYKSIDNMLAHIAFWRAVLFSLPMEPSVTTNFEKIESGAIPQLYIDDQRPRQYQTHTEKKQRDLESLQTLSIYRDKSTPVEIQVKSLGLSLSSSNQR